MICQKQTTLFSLAFCCLSSSCTFVYLPNKVWFWWILVSFFLSFLFIFILFSLSNQYYGTALQILNKNNRRAEREKNGIKTKRCMCGCARLCAPIRFYWSEIWSGWMTVNVNVWPFFSMSLSGYWKSAKYFHFANILFFSLAAVLRWKIIRFKELRQSFFLMKSLQRVKKTFFFVQLSNWSKP